MLKFNGIDEEEKVKKILDNDLFVKKNFEKLVKKYPKQMIVISMGEIFTGEDGFKNAKKAYPKAIPMILPVPGPDEFMHLL